MGSFSYLLHEAQLEIGVALKLMVFKLSQILRVVNKWSISAQFMSTLPLQIAAKIFLHVFSFSVENAALSPLFLAAVIL